MSLRTEPYLYYKHRLFPHIKQFRGSYRLLNVLEKLAMSKLDCIDEDPLPITELDYDNLIILDECRYSTYKELRPEAKYRISLGSTTNEFVKRNFSKNQWKDTVYITGNPHFCGTIFEGLTGRKTEETFHTVYNTYETDWDKEAGTVLPESINRDALNANKLFPDKKKIIHYMQPHSPFLESDYEQEKIRKPNEEKEIIPEPVKAEKGSVNPKKTIDNYKENLDIVLHKALELSRNLDGKTIITSDHGAFLGEEGFFGKIGNSDREILRKVPLERIS